MKRVSMLAVALSCGMWVLSQAAWGQSSGRGGSSQSGSQTSGGYGQSSGNQAQDKIQGCLTGSAGNYTLTDKSGATYQLGGDTSKLSEHVGESVEIKGSRGSGTSSSSGGASSGAGGGQTFNVTSVKKGSGSCSPSK